MRLPWDKDVVKLNKRGQKSITTNEYECYKQISTKTWNFIKNNIILTIASMSK